jgi:hypothetical protein
MEGEQKAIFHMSQPNKQKISGSAECKAEQRNSESKSPYSHTSLSQPDLLEGTASRTYHVENNIQLLNFSNFG